MSTLRDYVPEFSVQANTERGKPVEADNQNDEDEARMARLMQLLALEEEEAAEAERKEKEKEKESGRKRPKSALKTESSKVTYRKLITSPDP